MKGQQSARGWWGGRSVGDSNETGSDPSEDLSDHAVAGLLEVAARSSRQYFFSKARDAVQPVYGNSNKRDDPPDAGADSANAPAVELERKWC